jgi:hypothetical protein
MTYFVARSFQRLATSFFDVANTFISSCLCHPKNEHATFTVCPCQQKNDLATFPQKKKGYPFVLLPTYWQVWLVHFEVWQGRKFKRTLPTSKMSLPHPFMTLPHKYMSLPPQKMTLPHFGWQGHFFVWQGHFKVWQGHFFSPEQK